MTNTVLAKESILLLVVSLVLGLFIAAAFVVNFLIPFIEEKRYLKLEINRSTGNERKYWERELKKLYTRYIPLARFFIKNKKK